LSLLNRGDTIFQKERGEQVAILFSSMISCPKEPTYLNGFWEEMNGKFISKFYQWRYPLRLELKNDNILIILISVINTVRQSISRIKGYSFTTEAKLSLTA